MAVSLEPIVQALPAATTYSFEQLGKSMLKDYRKGNLIGRYIHWLKKSDSGVESIGKGILTGVQIAGLGVSIIGIPLIILGASASSKIDKYQKLRKVADGKEFEVPPIDSLPPVRDTSSMSFNHTHEFVLYKKFIWVKPIWRDKEKEIKTDRSDWKLFYFDGYIKGLEPVEISADGANFAAMDNKRDVHYKKILEESRSKFLCWSGKYHSVDLIKADNYETAWFTFPIIGLIYNLFHDKLLRLPENVSWSMSHRGIFVQEFTDKDGYIHKEVSMTTTIHFGYIGTNKIGYADPYWYEKIKNEIPPLPEGFKIICISSSASILFVYGQMGDETFWYEQRAADFDTLGRNPVLPGFWSEGLRPDTRWRVHPGVPLTGVASHDSKITIYQTGIGSDQRRLTVTGTGPTGQTGVYSKMITEMKPSDWKFEEMQVTF